MNRESRSELRELLSSMEPELGPHQYVYCSMSGGAGNDLSPICAFQESEGATLILERAQAEKHGLPFSFPCRKITLRVHSSLEAVGFLARITAELAQSGISTNCISAFHHDHLFVPAAEAERALRLLQDLQRTAANRNEEPAWTGAAVIQPMTMADYDAFRNLIAGTPGVVLRSADSREAIERYLARNPGLSFVARSEGRIVGCVLCGHDGRRGYLHHLAVAPDARRLGIGTALVRCGLEALRKLGIEKTHIDVFTENSTAHAFWTRSGWQRRSDLVRYSFTASTDPNA